MTLSQAVIATLRYSDHFAFPLTLKEIHSRLISLRSSQSTLSSELKNLLSSGELELTGNFYHLPGRSSLVKSRRLRAASSQPLLTHAQTLASQLGRFPGVLAVYLTGSLAMRNTLDGDVDFMIITYPGRLWTTRLFLTLYTSLLGLRRTPHSRRNSGKLCLNLYLTPTSLSLPQNKRSLYTAYELIQAVPLYDPQNTHAALLADNSWLKSYLPNFPFPKIVSTGSRDSGLRIYAQILEGICYHLQLAYMKSKITREVVTPDSAFFHPTDPGAKVLKELSL